MQNVDNFQPYGLFEVLVLWYYYKCWCWSRRCM